jgi:hypothetical protein
MLYPNSLKILHKVNDPCAVFPIQMFDALSSPMTCGHPKKWVT